MASERRALRRITDPVVAAAPAGVRIRTRIRLTEAEVSALTAIGTFLGSVYRAEFAARVELGRLDYKAHAVWRAQRKQALTAVSSSRWAGAITRAVQDQYQLGMRALSAHVADLRSAIDVLEARCALRPGEQQTLSAGARQSRRWRGYRTPQERFGKTRRLAILRGRLAVAQEALDASRPSVTVGGKRLWRHRNHLDEAGMTQQQWRARWDGARMFFTADGESGKAGGNETIRVDGAGRLRIKVPAGLIDQHGTHLDIAAPVTFSHRGAQWAGRVAGRRAVRYDISYDPSRGRWYLDASWKQDTVVVASSIEALRTGPVLGVDLNADHLAACVLDGSGNPVGDPATIPVDTVGLPATQRDGRVRAAITALLDTADHAGCTGVVIENLDFTDARAVGRDTMGRGRRGKSFRRTVAGIPTAKFRTRLSAMAARRGIAIIGVDPAYTSRWGVAGTPPARPERHPDHVGRHGSSGPPPPTRWVAVHRRTPATSGQDRSGRNRAALTPAHS